jgi:hypothetical protein
MEVHTVMGKKEVFGNSVLFKCQVRFPNYSIPVHNVVDMHAHAAYMQSPH